MTKKKSVLLIIIALVVGIVLGVGVTVGVSYMNGTGSIIIPSQTRMDKEETSFDFLDKYCKSSSKCEIIKNYEYFGFGDTVTKQRLISAKWKVTVKDINAYSKLYPFFTVRKDGKTSVQECKNFSFMKLDDYSGLESTITWVPSSTDDAVFRSPGENDINLHLFFTKLYSSHGEDGEEYLYISDDGRIMITDPDAFYSGKYTKDSVMYYGTEEELASGEYSFLYDYRGEITIHDASQFRSDLSTWPENN